MASMGKDIYTAQEKIQETSNNFYLPPIEYKLIVDGSKIYEKEMLNKWNIHMIDVCVPLYGAGSAVIKFGEFDDTFRQFSPEISLNFKIGSVVEIFLGYANQASCKSVFKGFIYMIGEEYDRLSTEGMISYVVTIMDARKLMMINGERHKLVVGNSYLSIVQNVCKSYPQTITGAVIGDISVSKSSVINLSQNTNDYDFIVNDIVRSGKVGADFYISCGKAYFKSRPMKEVASPIAFSINRDESNSLYYFKSERVYCNKKIKVYGYDYDEDKSVTSITNLISTDKLFLSAGAMSIQSSDYTDVLVNSSDLVQDVATNLENRIKSKTLCSVGKGKMNPNVAIGTVIAVNGVDNISAGLHFVTKVRHEVQWKLNKSQKGDNDFIDGVTYFECEGL